MHGYEESAETLPERLNAMFAFAIYDAPRRRLFLARDRFGEKPPTTRSCRACLLFQANVCAMPAS